MALVTRELGRAYDTTDPALAAVVTVDYDDADLRVRAVRVANATSFLARLSARRADGTGAAYTLEVPAGQTREVTVPTTPAQRIQCVLDAQGRLDGMDTSFGLF